MLVQLHLDFVAEAGSLVVQQSTALLRHAADSCTGERATNSQLISARQQGGLASHDAEGLPLSSVAVGQSLTPGHGRVMRGRPQLTHWTKHTMLDMVERTARQAGLPRSCCKRQQKHASTAPQPRKSVWIASCPSSILLSTDATPSRRGSQNCRRQGPPSSKESSWKRLRSRGSVCFAVHSQQRGELAAE